jgi:redox-sensitive bicupin YhaK (pirin superfamily)
MDMERRVANVSPAERVIDDGDMLLWRALPLPARRSLGPFVFIDHYRHRSRRGIGDSPHPHAGIEVLSYILDGGVEHRDSLGNVDHLSSGDAQWIRAGRGIIHVERPDGGRHGLQLWTNLPPAQKHAEPAYASFRAADIPLFDRNGAQVRVVTGNIGHTSGPIQLATPTVFAHATLAAGASVTIPTNEADELGLYVTDGSVEITGSGVLGQGSLAVLTSGDCVRVIAAKNGPASFALLGGTAAQGAILFSGPFVMDTPARLRQAHIDYEAGKMGTLDGVPF